MLCIISDSEVAFFGQFTPPLLSSSYFPAKPLLEIVVKGKPNGLHVLLTTKIPRFFLHLPIPNDCQKEWISPSTCSISLHSPRAGLWSFCHNLSLEVMVAPEMWCLLWALKFWWHHFVPFVPLTLQGFLLLSELMSPFHVCSSNNCLTHSLYWIFSI